MRNLIAVLLIFMGIFACSSSDDDNNNDPNNQNPTEVGHYSLTINGGGFTDQRVELFKDTINSIGVGTLFSASDTFGYAIGIVVPSSGEGETTIEEHPGEVVNIFGYDPNTSVFFFGNDRYLSENGTFTVTENEFADPCVFWRGSLNINYTLNGDGGDIVNIQGDFDIPSYNCED